MATDTAYTYATLAKRWMCSMDVLYDLVRSGKLRAFKVGHNTRISAAEVERYELEGPYTTHH